MVRALDRLIENRTLTFVSADEPSGMQSESEETRLRWLLADDYEVLTRLGSGSFGSVWRVGGLSGGRAGGPDVRLPPPPRHPPARRRLRRRGLPVAPALPP